jgi:hypothetical protein
MYPRTSTTPAGEKICRFTHGDNHPKQDHQYTKLCVHRGHRSSGIYGHLAGFERDVPHPAVQKSKPVRYPCPTLRTADDDHNLEEPNSRKGDGAPIGRLAGL